MSWIYVALVLLSSRALLYLSSYLKIGLWTIFTIPLPRNTMVCGLLISKASDIIFKVLGHVLVFPIAGEVVGIITIITLYE